MNFKTFNVLLFLFFTFSSLSGICQKTNPKPQLLSGKWKLDRIMSTSGSLIDVARNPEASKDEPPEIFNNLQFVKKLLRASGIEFDAIGSWELSDNKLKLTTEKVSKEYLLIYLSKEVLIIEYEITVNYPVKLYYTKIKG